jgi:hypothetical protein
MLIGMQEDRMKNSLNAEQVKKAFVFVFEDENSALKLLVAGGLLLANIVIPLIPMIIVLGYSVVIMKQVIEDGSDPSLPEWEDWGDLMLKGLRVLGLNIIPAIPIFFLVIFTIGLNFASVAMLNGLPSDSPLTIFSVLVSGVGIFMTIGFILFFSILGFLWSILYPVILGYVVDEERFGAVFSVGAWWRIFKSDPAGFLFVFFIVLVANSVLAIVSQFAIATIVLICLLPIAFAVFMPYIILVSNTLYAQAYRNAVVKMKSADLIE